MWQSLCVCKSGVLYLVQKVNFGFSSNAIFIHVHAPYACKVHALMSVFTTHAQLVNARATNYGDIIKSVCITSNVLNLSNMHLHAYCVV